MFIFVLFCWASNNHIVNVAQMQDNILIHSKCMLSKKALIAHICCPLHA